VVEEGGGFEVNVVVDFICGNDSWELCLSPSRNVWYCSNSMLMIRLYCSIYTTIYALPVLLLVVSAHIH
jgi:hypothetical protein